MRLGDDLARIFKGFIPLTKLNRIERQIQNKSLSSCFLIF